MPSSLPRLALLRALSHKPFALVWSGQTVSRLGDALYLVALSWWVLQKTGSATDVGIVFTCQTVPLLIFVLVGGVLTDRLPRIPVMFASDIARGVLSAAVAVLAGTGQLEIWHVYIAASLFGVVSAFFHPAYSASIPDLVPSDDLPSANSLNSISNQVGGVLGPGIAGIIVAVGGPVLGFSINALSFFVSAAFLLPLLRNVPPRLDTNQHKRGLLAEAREGLSLVLSTPLLWVTLLFYSLTNIAGGGLYRVTLPALVRDNLHESAGVLGTLYAMFAIGFLVGGLLVGVLGRRVGKRHRVLLIYSIECLAALLLMVFGLQVPVPLLALAAVLNGTCIEFSSLIWTNLLQSTVPAGKLGRVLSIGMLGSYALVPVGYALAGPVTDRLGAPASFLLGGGLNAVLALLALFQLVLRRQVVPSAIEP